MKDTVQSSVSSGRICAESTDTDFVEEDQNPDAEACITVEEAANMTVQNLFEVGSIWGEMFSQMFGATINTAV